LAVVKATNHPSARPPSLIRLAVLLRRAHARYDILCGVEANPTDAQARKQLKDLLAASRRLAAIAKDLDATPMVWDVAARHVPVVWENATCEQHEDFRARGISGPAALTGELRHLLRMVPMLRDAAALAVKEREPGSTYRRLGHDKPHAATLLLREIPEIYERMFRDATGSPIRHTAADWPDKLSPGMRFSLAAVHAITGSAISPSAVKMAQHRKPRQSHGNQKKAAV